MTVPASRVSGQGAERNGLGNYVAAVETARDRLGSDLDLLTTEVRAQMGTTVEKTAWKLAGTGAALVAGFAARRILILGWRATRKSEPPSNPAARTTSWAEALSWALASGIAMAVARLVAMRGAAAGWERATGSLPPGLEEVA